LARGIAQCRISRLSGQRVALRGERHIFGPLSKNNTGMAAQRAGLPVISKSCRQRWLHSCLFDKVVHLQIWGAVVYFKAHLVTVNLLFATVKESLKSDSICHSYGQMKKGLGFFLIYSVVYCANI